MTLKPLLLAAAMLVAFQAQAVSISGTTTGAPTFNRTVAGTPPSGLSGVGTAVPYSVTSFAVGTAGVYTFLSIAIGGWDNFTALYAGTFTPGSGLSNVVVANDDYLNDINNLGVSGFTATLATGTTYRFVTTGFSNTSFGAFTNSITGPGTVTVVPEVATSMMLALGLAAFALTRRRSASQQG